MLKDRLSSKNTWTQQQTHLQAATFWYQNTEKEMEGPSQPCHDSPSGKVTGNSGRLLATSKGWRTSVVTKECLLLARKMTGPDEPVNSNTPKPLVWAMYTLHDKTKITTASKVPSQRTQGNKPVHRVSIEHCKPNALNVAFKFHFLHNCIS